MSYQNKLSLAYWLNLARWIDFADCLGTINRSESEGVTIVDRPTPSQARFRNPYRPGAGHMPPYLAGRESERQEFEKLLSQDLVMENVILTGLRGVGKTVLLETFKPLAQQAGWLWVGTDMSETASLTEGHLCMRIITDLSVVASSIPYTFEKAPSPMLLYPGPVIERRHLDYAELGKIFDTTPGLPSDKLRAVLEFVWSHMQSSGHRGVIFSYDEAQNLGDHANRDEFPLSLLLDVFQSIQRKGIPFMLALTGLPTLFPKLVEARTFSERMFHIIFLDRLDASACREAIEKPLNKASCPVRLSSTSVGTIVNISGGYPYFIQFICREVYDILLQSANMAALPSVPVEPILRKLDTDFFAGRWAKVTDRQRQLLWIIAQLPNCDAEFTVQEIVERSKLLEVKPFSSSHVNQMLAALCEAGLVFKNRHGKYAFAVPLLGAFINRQMDAEQHGKS